MPPISEITDCKSTTRDTNTRDYSNDIQSYLIRINNDASVSMTNYADDFINTPYSVNLQIKGINGSISRNLEMDDSG
jgi:hypothetical protein